VRYLYSEHNFATWHVTCTIHSHDHDADDERNRPSARARTPSGPGRPDQTHRWRDLACPITNAGVWRLHREHRREDLYLPRLRTAPLPLQASVGGSFRTDIDRHQRLRRGWQHDQDTACQPTFESITDAHSASKDGRSRRGVTGASPPTPSEASGVAGVAGEGRPSAVLPDLAFVRQPIRTQS
jgi:hypothetical protein